MNQIPASAWLLFLLRRLVAAVFILFLISVVVFALVNLAPGSVVANVLGEGVSDPAAVARVRAEYHLDDNIVVQYLYWAKGAVHLDFGTSIQSKVPVWDVVTRGAALSLQLVLLSFLITLVVGVSLGVLAAVRAGSTLDRLIVTAATTGAGSPTFAIGLIALWLFGLQLGWFPIFGPGTGGLDRLYHLLLPAIVLAFHAMAFLIKTTRSAMLDTLRQDYVEFARLRGISRRRVLTRYALRNAAIPVMTASGLVVTGMVSGIVLIEFVFSLPGLGVQLVQSILFKDIPVIQALALVTAAAILLVNLVVDVLYSVVDPRIKLGAERA